MESQETTNAVLAQALKSLDDKIVEGFKTTHEKQNYTNGKVSKAGDDIINLQKKDADLENQFAYNKIIWYMLTVTISVIVTLVSYIIFKKGA